MDETDYTYAAGIIDGEGSISIIKPSNQGPTVYKLAIQVSIKSDGETLAVVPRQLHENFGGSIGTYKLGGRAWGKGYQTKWTIHGRKAQDFLQCILPYLKEKYYHAELALDFPVNIRGIRCNEDELEARDAIYELMYGLNPKALRRA